MRLLKSILLVLILGTMVTGCGACVDDGRIIAGVEIQGFSNVKILDKSIFFVGLHGCSDSDNAAYDVEATNARGQRVQLMACAGVYKGVTVRSP